MENPNLPESDQVIDGKVFAILSYLSILCIVPLLFKKDNDFVLSHSKQGLVLFIGEVIVFVAHILLGAWLFRFGMFIFGLLSLLGIFAVLKGEEVKIPIAYGIADKITL